MQQRNYIPTLDGWRAIAIGVVVLGHALHFHWAVQGVEIFFGISGYLICTNLLVERERTGGISLADFYRRRVFRILPASLAYLLILGVLTLLGLAAATGKDILSCIFLFANYFSERGWEVKHFWSLSMEEHFYLLWPALLAFLGNRRARMAALAGILAVFLWRVWVIGHNFDIVSTNAMSRTDLRLDVFLVPCVMAMLLRGDSWRNRAKKIGPLLCVALVAVLGLLKLYRGTSATFVSFELLYQSFVFPVLIIYTVFHPTTLAGKLLELAPLRWIGKISYSIYLWQQIFVQPSWVFNHVTFVPFRLAGVLIMASLSFYLIERPMIRVGRKFGERAVPEVKVLVPQPTQGDPQDLVVKS